VVALVTGRLANLISLAYRGSLLALVTCGGTADDMLRYSGAPSFFSPPGGYLI
jgi:hypothetical protein